MILPSEKLLSAVLNRDMFPLNMEQNGRVLRMAVIDGSKRKKHINIYELMHLMKAFADKTEYYFTIFLGGNIDIDINKKYIKGMYVVKVNSVSGNTEFEAVTKACEWILEQKEKDK